MPSIFKKLNLKDQREIVVLDAPASFEAEIAALQDVAVRRSVDEVERVQFSLAFVTKQEQIDALAGKIAGKVAGDVVVWFAYPKGTSKRYRCDFNRDTGWDALGAAGFEPVRQVAIDDEWTAIQVELRGSYQRIIELIEWVPAWPGELEIAGAIGVIAHTAYHLGEIRQALCTIRM